MIIDIEIRGVESESAEYRSGDLTGNPVIKYQMRKKIAKPDMDLIRYVWEEVWTEWEDIPIITTNSSSR